MLLLYPSYIWWTLPLVISLKTQGKADFQTEDNSLITSAIAYKFSAPKKTLKHFWSLLAEPQLVPLFFSKDNV